LIDGRFTIPAPAGTQSVGALGGYLRNPSRLLYSRIQFGSSSTQARTWPAILASLALVGLLTGLGFWIAPIIKGPNLAVLYVLAVVFSALQWGRRAAIVSAVSGALCFDFFVPPARSFAIGDFWYLITLLGLLTVGLLTSILTVSAREDARLARQRESQTAALYSFSKALAEETEDDRILAVLAQHLVSTFARPIALWLPDTGGLKMHFASPELALGEDAQEAARWVFEKGHEAGYGTGIFKNWPLRYRPIKTSHGAVGVLGISPGSGKEWLTEDQRELLDVFMNQAALAVTRAQLARKAQRAELLQQADKLQKALLNSVSHDLRTPLVSVIGGINTVLHDAALLDASTQRALLETAREQAIRLNRLIQNLLDMTRLQGGSLPVKSEPCDVHDVVGSALEQMGEAARKRSISVVLARDMPLVPMDHVLIVQVLVNLLDNAIKYSAATTPIEIEGHIEGSQLQIRIADQGKGIPDEELDRLFETFFRGESAKGSRGAGLGLSICKGFVEAHRGRIWAKQRPKGGTEIVFSLPTGTTE
jgi:two-component system sensor histidine kinase KdpD